MYIHINHNNEKKTNNKNNNNSDNTHISNNNNSNNPTFEVGQPRVGTPNLPAKIVPTKIVRLKLSGKLPVDVRIPPRKIQIPLESNPSKSRISVRRLAVMSGHVKTWLE